MVFSAKKVALHVLSEILACVCGLFARMVLIFTVSGEEPGQDDSQDAEC